MKRKSSFLWILFAFVFAGILVMFLGLDFFPSQNDLKFNLMMLVIALQSIAIVGVIWKAFQGKSTLFKILAPILGGLAIFASLVLMMLDHADFMNDRELIEVIDDVESDTRIEVFSMEMHDHFAIEVYVGNAGGTLAREVYFEDHFFCEELVKEKGRIRFLNSENDGELILDLKSRSFSSQGGS